jgi:hypothetical protein
MVTEGSPQALGLSQLADAAALFALGPRILYRLSTTQLIVWVAVRTPNM